MAYIGNAAPSRFVSNRAASVYSGDGSTVAFTLEQVVTQDEDVLVSVDGVVQEPSVAYAVSSGTTLTFTAAPSSNSGNNIFVYYLASQAGTVGHPSSQALSATNGTFSGNTTVAGTLGVTGATTLSTKLATTNLGTGAVVQVVNVQSGTLATGTTAIPGDNTIPQNNEGVEFFTLAITPTSASSKLLITINAVMGNEAAQWPTIALFQDSTANALAVSTNFQDVAQAGNTVSLMHFMTAGTTSATTFKMRFGLASTSPAYMNGPGGAALFGGTCSTSMSVMEIAV